SAPSRSCLLFCLLPPVRHAHLAVHRRRRGEMLPRLITLARAPEQLAEAEVAVGDEGAHAARLGEHQRFLIVGLASLGIEPVGMGRDRKSTRLNSSHQIISYAVFCLKKKRT